MLQDLTNAGASGSTPPPCSKQGVKNDHSPWSAPRERKRRTKPADIALSSIEEIEYATSPPKRHNGGAGGSRGRPGLNSHAPGAALPHLSLPAPC